MTWTEQAGGTFFRSQAEGWLLSVIRNQADATGRRTLQATLERDPEPGESRLELIRPAQVWMELHAAPDQPATIPQRWGRRYDVPAASWEAVAERWPTGPDGKTPRKPVLKAWWLLEAMTPTAALVKGADFQAIEQINDHRISVEGQDLLIESISVESPRVDPSWPAGRRDRFLVVRMNYPAGKPHWVAPYRIVPTLSEYQLYSEHRFYERANAYTGIFGPIDDSQVNAYLAGFHVYSVESFKARARGLGLSTESGSRPAIEGETNFQHPSGLEPPAPPLQTPEPPLPLPTAHAR